MKLRIRMLLQEIAFDIDEVTIGRSTDCAVTIDDDLLSRRHAVIRAVRGHFEVEDLGSRNGTKLNGERLQGARVVRTGDRIRVGGTDLVVLLDEPASDSVDSKRRLRTGRYEMCPRCGESRPAEVIGCARCGLPQSSKS